MGGWRDSARAWIEAIDAGDSHREMLLDGVMLTLCEGSPGERVLDLGCGEGRFSRMLTARAANVVALDLVRELTREAYRRGQHDVVAASAEVLPFREASFDLVVSYITLVDIPDFRAAIRESARVLRPGGRLAFAGISFMSAGNGWARDARGRRLNYPIDDYFAERSSELEWQGIRITNWHRPLSAYMAAFLGEGLVLEDFQEPMPKDQIPYWTQANNHGGATPGSDDFPVLGGPTSAICPAARAACVAWRAC